MFPRHSRLGGAVGSVLRVGCGLIPICVYEAQSCGRFSFSPVVTDLNVNIPERLWHKAAFMVLEALVALIRSRNASDIPKTLDSFSYVTWLAIVALVLRLGEPAFVTACAPIAKDQMAEKAKVYVYM
ncbi:hypothetical protein T440DRAFT_466556 [Plenodomus tracheiphilus IPT5]|uniref:Uncharacterized protein n=1 Tax=Plenodomus tracheiphilus IPT5 TaxID=1408161 RepID=A0A6A7BCC4_9PLEO|nr:hypothetical protein T440DRAFT_466556 [Plenodomus tracheiphilus IPT5]